MSKRNLKVQLKRTPEQIDLVKRMGSKNKTESLAAAEALAAVMAQPILQVIEQAPVISNLYQTLTYGADQPSLINLDPYFDVRAANFLNVWSQSQPGGTSTNFNIGQSSIYVQTYPIESAISMNKNQLRAGDLDYLAAYLTRIAQEVLLVQQTNAAFVLFNSVAGARIDGTTSTATTNLPICRVNTANVFQIDDFNTMMIGYDRTTASWVGGTPVNDLREITDVLGSPEWIGQIRSIAYQPQNTRQGAVTTQGGSSISAPDSVRLDAWRGAGVPTFFDKNLHKVYEMGAGSNRAYNNTFDVAAGATAYPGYGAGFGGGNTSAFDGPTEEIVVGLNVDMFDLARLRMTDTNGEFNLVNDDTFSIRSDKLGYVGGLTEGYLSVEGRAKFSMIM